jgi:hypothetical protein
MALFFNPPILLMSKAFGSESGDTRHDTLRNAVLASMIKPAGLGLAVALMLAKRSAPEPRLPPPVSAPAGAAGAAGAAQTPAIAAAPATTAAVGAAATPPADMAPIHNMLSQLIPHDFFPSFIGYTWRQALELAHVANLIPHPHGDQKGLVVVRQCPDPGQEWPKGTTTVSLTFGSRETGAK